MKKKKESKVQEFTIHESIKKNIQEISKNAHVESQYILNTSLGICTPTDLSWVKDVLLENNDIKRICYFLDDPVIRFSAMAGIFIRCLIYATLVTPFQLNDLIALPEIIFMYNVEHVDVTIKSKIINILTNPPCDLIINIKDKQHFKNQYGETLYNNILNKYMTIL